MAQNIHSSDVCNPFYNEILDFLKSIFDSRGLFLSVKHAVLSAHNKVSISVGLRLLENKI